MLSTCEGHALFIGTPKGKDHFYDLYLKGQQGKTHENGWWSCSYTTLDGGNVSPEELSNAKGSLDIRVYRQEYEASFETFCGRCLYAFSRKHSVKNTIYDEKKHVHIGMDFNINPMSATVWQETTDNNGNLTTTQVDEIIIQTSNTDEMSQEILKRYGTKQIDFSGSENYSTQHITVYPDPAGQARKTSASGKTDISILLSYGINIKTRKQSPRVRDRMNFMNSMFENSLKEKKAFVSSKCIKSIESYERYAFIPGTSEPDKKQGYDHLVDASGYYLYFRFSENTFDIKTNKILDR
ncbi:hypothetical protein [Acetobacter sp.]|jgi:hypothetical protein|uniref:hypothetical protein n=1 Tax=Acetobacter sp. TaxID=440 RepID=UPI0025C36A09|nr:hypothetical protein [Acetobacter sp.]MCH4091550.1 hypothetical protein [Acetobacter sp.]MCI1299528.1 hypothetical protein [Acetobacter sp.]MCI1316882.1 hypothetical protein [Acetobacter sp.]